MATKGKAVQCGSVAALIAIPALAVAFLSGSLAGGLSLPSLQLSETREFNRAGQNLTVPADTKEKVGEPVEIFLGDWQNTTRIPPSPRV